MQYNYIRRGFVNITTKVTFFMKQKKHSIAIRGKLKDWLLVTG